MSAGKPLTTEYRCLCFRVCFNQPLWQSGQILPPGVGRVTIPHLRLEASNNSAGKDRGGQPLADCVREFPTYSDGWIPIYIRRKVFQRLSDSLRSTLFPLGSRRQDLPIFPNPRSIVFPDLRKICRRGSGNEIYNRDLQPSNFPRLSLTQAKGVQFYTRSLPLRISRNRSGLRSCSAIW